MVFSSCEENSNCISLSCGHDSIHLEFDGNFFGVENGDVNSFDEKFHTEFTDGKRHVFFLNEPMLSYPYWAQTALI